MKTKTRKRTPKGKARSKAKTIGAKDTVLVMRQCFYDERGRLVSRPPYPGTPFEYPSSGPVEAPDWNASARCGGGLHGFLWGVGNPQTTGTSMESALPWLAIRCSAYDVVKIDDDKCKFRRGVVERVGPLSWVAAYVAAEAPTWTAVIGSTVRGGSGSTVNGGHYSTVSGGDRSTASGSNYSTVSGGRSSTVCGGAGSTVSGGHYSTVIGGDGSAVSGGDYSTVSGGAYSTVIGGCGSTVIGGYGSTVSGGDRSTVSGGYGSTVNGGDRSTVIGGDGSAVSGGDCSTVSGGAYSTVIGGYGSTVIGGDGSTVSGGADSTITVKWWDATASRWRLSVAYTGESEIKAGVRYKVSADGKFIEVMP